MPWDEQITEVDVVSPEMFVWPKRHAKYLQDLNYSTPT